ncbi:MAG TPA: response regulator [Gemmatimonadales bacterium]|nr:response regulator [Gemmatimonadales bacterium]
MARILIVDNDPDMRELIELALDGQGYDVDSVDSGRAALERLTQHSYDLVVCDLHMPDRDGPAVYRALARRPPPRPAFLFVTGYADAGPYEEFLRTVPVPVVGKPFDITVLRETVRRVLSRP